MMILKIAFLHNLVNMTGPLALSRQGVSDPNRPGTAFVNYLSDRPAVAGHLLPAGYFQKLITIRRLHADIADLGFLKNFQGHLYPGGPESPALTEKVGQAADGSLIYRQDDIARLQARLFSRPPGGDAYDENATVSFVGVESQPGLRRPRRAAGLDQVGQNRLKQINRDR
jgi:hypothetical protein